MEHLLFLAHRVPFPPNKGDKVRSYHLLKYLAGRYRVHLGAFVDDEADLAHAVALKGLCEDYHLVRLIPAVAKAKSLAGLISGEPLTLPYYRSEKMSQWVAATLRERPIERALVFSSAMAQYVLGAEGLGCVADLVDVDSDKWRQYAQTRAFPLSAVYRREACALLAYEREIARRCDATVFVSPAEAELFKRLAPESADKVWHVNNGVDADYFFPGRDYPNPYADGEQVLAFTGAMDYWPNVDAVAWFAREVFPAVHRQRPSARFYIVGARPAAEVVGLAGLPGVSVTGGVPDIRPYLAHARLAVAPLRLARGVQNKVLEAMAMAKPVLVSPQAAEGIAAEPGKELLVAAGRDEFVALALQALEGGLSPGIGAAARARVLAAYAWEANLARFDALLAGSGAGPKEAGWVNPEPRPSKAGDGRAALRPFKWTP